MSSTHKATANTDTMPFLERLCEIYEAVSIGDDALENHVIDNRRMPGSPVPMGVVPTQTIPAPTITPVTTKRAVVLVQTSLQHKAQ
jgi:hypothetical protein